MTKSIVKKEQNSLVTINNKLLNDYLNTFGIAKQLPDSDKKKFLNIAKAFELNPFKREIYAITYNGAGGKNTSIIVGFEVYLKRAERTGKLDGWNVTTNGSLKDGSLSATINIYRKDWKYPFTHTVYFSEYNMGNKIWREKPITMLKKVVMSQGFRLCFPDELGGLPYTAEEQWIEENLNKAMEMQKENEKLTVMEPDEQIKIVETIDNKPVNKPKPAQNPNKNKARLKKHMETMLKNAFDKVEIDHMKMLLGIITATPENPLGLQSFKDLTEETANQAVEELFNQFGTPPHIDPNFFTMDDNA